MFVRDEWRSTVCFLVRDPSARPLRPVGTGFFVSVPLDGVAATEVCYVVTAGHVAELGKDTAAPLWAVVNAKGGGIEQAVIDPSSWREPETGVTDVSVAPVSPKLFALASSTRIHERLFVRGQTDGNYLIGVGQTVCMLGLFSNHPGKGSIQPVARFGHISLLSSASEKVYARIGESPDGTPCEAEIEAHVVESHSWGGASGSPVFTYYSVPMRTETGWVIGYEFGGVLGIVQGHWNRPSDVRTRSINSKSNASGSYVDVNSGFAIVIPAEQISEALRHPELLAQRSKLASALRMKP
jgi:hypothetical protein